MEGAATLTRLQAEVARVLSRDEVDVDVGLAELGLDSLKIVELILACYELYGKDVDPDELAIDQFTTLRDLDRQMREIEPVAVK
jgi:acyl carrier protein